MAAQLMGTKGPALRGECSCSARARTARSSSWPLMPGIIRSVSTTSTGSSRRSSSAAGPVPARRKRQPSRAKMRSRESRLACSSSTPRTVPCMDGLYCAAGMPTALIGPDGFIGKNLEAQAHFDEKTDGALRPGSYDLVVCAGAPGGRWRANRDPEDDAAAIRRLIESLREVQTGKFVLISTVDVYPRTMMFDVVTPIDAAASTP